MKSAFLAATFAVTAIASAAADAAIDLHSGTDAQGHVLAAGTLDPFWTLSTNGSDFSAARVAYPGAFPDFGSGQTCCGMESVDSTAAWITTGSVVATSPSTGWGVGNTVYARRTFDLSAYEVDSVALTGKWRVADSAAGIFVNGHAVAGTHAGGGFTFATDQAFSVTAGSGFFVAGVNTIEMRGTSVNSVWDAFWISTTVTGNPAPVPEPETWALLAAGLAFVGVVSRKRR